MKLISELVELIAAKLPDVVQKVLIASEGRLCVAGGFIRDSMFGEEPSDVDIFGVDWVAVKDGSDAVGWEPSYIKKTTANAITFSPWYKTDNPDIQFITRVYYRNHLDLIESFDFTVCQACLFYSPSEGWVGYACEEFMQHAFARELHYKGPIRDEDPAGSFLRVVKFLKRGFSISEDDLAQVVARMMASVVVCVPEAELYRGVAGQFRRVGYAGKPERVM